MTKVKTLETKATKALRSKKEQIAIDKLIAMDNQIHELEKTLAILKQEKAAFLDSNIEDVELHEFKY